MSDNAKLYFHNLKFDGEFLIDKLLRLGYMFKTSKETTTDKSFTALINDMGMFFSMKIIFKKSLKKTQKVDIYDSLKLIPNSSVKNIAKNFNLEWQKGEIDYHKYRPIGHKITDDELKYLRSDVTIMALALEKLFETPKMKTTIGGSALAYYKDIIGDGCFKRWFPKLPNEIDADIRRAYRGGYTYSDPRFRDRVIFRFNVLDYNSLYPSVMYDKPLPYGEPVYFDGKYKTNKEYPLFVQAISCQFELKENHIPTIQIKHNGRFVDTEYLTTSKWYDEDNKEVDEPTILYLTNMDLELLFKHYNVYNLEYISGHMFKQSTTMFKTYIDHWSAVKIKAKKENNASLYTIAKLYLNSLYGKMGTSPKCRNKYPYMNEETDEVNYILSEPTEKPTIYIPCAIFITSWARYTTITEAQNNYNVFMYADTDSLHLFGRKLPDGLDVDNTRLGALDHELVGWKAKYMGQKAYIEYGMSLKDAHNKTWKRDENGKRIVKTKKKVTVAGMPENCHQYVTFENFYPNAPPIQGKLRSKRCRGGVVLIEDVFTFKERLTK